MIYYFRAKYGYKPSDQVSFELDELEKALYAQISGKPIEIGGKYITGSHIFIIEPHYHRHTGWYDWYEPKDGEDWTQIERDCPNYDGIIEQAKLNVAHLIQTNQVNLIGKDMSYIKLPEKKNRELGTGVKSIGEMLQK